MTKKEHAADLQEGGQAGGPPEFWDGQKWSTQDGPEAAFVAILALIPQSTTPDLRAIREIATAALVRLGMDADHVAAIYHP